jgi:hypothetical protein
MEAEKKPQMGGRKATEWNKLVKRTFAEGKEIDPEYRLKDAMKDAKKKYRKSTSKMSNSMARSNRRSFQARKAKSRRNRYSSSTRRAITI